MCLSNEGWMQDEDRRGQQPAVVNRPKSSAQRRVRDQMFGTCRANARDPRGHPGCDGFHGGDAGGGDVEPVPPPAPRAAGRTVFTQGWRALAFLHWAVAPERVAPLLPPGTRP